MNTLALLRHLKHLRDVVLDAGAEHRAVPELHAEVIATRAAIMPDELGAKYVRRRRVDVATRSLARVTGEWDPILRVYDPRSVTVTWRGQVLQALLPVTVTWRGQVLQALLPEGVELDTERETLTVVNTSSRSSLGSCTLTLLTERR